MIKKLGTFLLLASFICIVIYNHFFRTKEGSHYESAHEPIVETFSTLFPLPPGWEIKQLGISRLPTGSYRVLGKISQNPLEKSSTSIQITMDVEDLTNGAREVYRVHWIQDALDPIGYPDGQIFHINTRGEIISSE